MTSLRANFPDVLDESFRDIVQAKFAAPGKQYPDLFNMLTSTKEKEKDSSMGGFPSMPTKAEGVAIIYYDPLQGYDITYTHDSFGMGFRVSWEMYNDDQHACFRPFKKMSAALIRSAINAQEVKAWNILNRAFNATYAGGDAIELCSRLHPLTGGGYGINKLETASDLSVSSFQQALLDMLDSVDDQNMPIIIKAKDLWIPTELKFIAAELLKSELKPNSADNTKNVLADEGITAKISNYLTDPDAWFLAAAKDDHAMNFFMRAPPTEASDVDFDTKDLKFSLVQRFSVGFSDWRGVFGTPGAG